MKHIVMAVVMTGLMTAPALAQDTLNLGPTASAGSPGALWASFGAAPQAAAPAPAPKKVTFLTGADTPSLYFFRGIRQETDAGFTFQPYFDIGIAASPSVTLNFGLWNSLQSGTSGTGGDYGALYETDFYASATFTAGKFKPGVLFTSYTSPNDVFKTVNELAAVIAFDDSANKVPLSPKVVLAFELSGQADGGSNEGTYLEFGLKPAFKAGSLPVTIAVPLKFGFSLNDYYESAVSGEDSGFGYFDIGANVSVPLPVKKGGWEIHGGIDVYTLGTTLKEFNQGDKSRVVGNFGFSVTF